MTTTVAKKLILLSLFKLCLDELLPDSPQKSIIEPLSPTSVKFCSRWLHWPVKIPHFHSLVHRASSQEAAASVERTTPNCQRPPRHRLDTISA